ncbi:tRNA uracil 4-sulfurtransferase ThiI [Peptostreptococcus canis]|uniref:Probable tRNA sulfurtransferase n=1 Tax=Peptostreptococcus canis TaxID=1159213 RepID=A0ABR6TJJ9_9FIRM|nr:tRNA uracil 4-sulfurtransferase ThiI [Peptostreptococcus canis]MBC2575364.1 tRNA 4-thiouridine(8) synthase ThiI [Peptostreptococcus canis]MBP1997453.1 thiamine biosynthesis protein ThiI [Peptostreptococcus canis]
MYNILIAKYGEIGVKGKNRYIFENKLIRNIRNMLKSIGEFNVYKEYGRIYIDVNDSNYKVAVEEVRKVFGVVGVCPAIKREKDYDMLKETALMLLREKISMGAKTFKIASKRGDKSFKFTSQEMSIDIGGYVLSNINNKDVSVDVRNPDVTITCEYRNEHILVYADSISGFGGLPLGTNGKAMTLLSGGIDSPVASWLVAKRGVDIEAVHFHSYPFTNERSQEKVRELAKILSKYCGPIKLHMVNILEIQKSIANNCNEEETTILSRRFMMRIAEEIGVKRYCDALITGESIGQVASQTMQGITCTNAAVSIPVFRPLIAMDKIDIIKTAENIGTYETSIIPEVDCCSLFSPKKPVTKPRLERIEKSESKLDVDKLIKSAIDASVMEVISYE